MLSSSQSVYVKTGAATDLRNFMVHLAVCARNFRDCLSTVLDESVVQRARQALRSLGSGCPMDLDADVDAHTQCFTYVLLAQTCLDEGTLYGMDPVIEQLFVQLKSVEVLPTMRPVVEALLEQTTRQRLPRFSAPQKKMPSFTLRSFPRCLRLETESGKVFTIRQTSSLTTSLNTFINGSSRVRAYRWD